MPAGTDSEQKPIYIVLYKLSVEYIIDKLSAYSIQDDNRKIPIDCGKCHMKHDVTILLTSIPTI